MWCHYVLDTAIPASTEERAGQGKEKGEQD